RVVAAQVRAGELDHAARAPCRDTSRLIGWAVAASGSGRPFRRSCTLAGSPSRSQIRGPCARAAPPQASVCSTSSRPVAEPRRASSQHAPVAAVTVRRNDAGAGGGVVVFGGAVVGALEGACEMVGDCAAWLERSLPRVRKTV